MLANLLITFLISSQIFFSTAIKDGQILGTQSPVDLTNNMSIEIKGPQRIINKNLGVRISASSAIVIDKVSDKILFSKNHNQERPIASITKLMTAIIFLETNPDLKKEIEIISEDITDIGKINLLLGEKSTLEDLFYLSLVSSDNNATLSLVRSTGISEQEFVEKMNQKAKELNLNNTHFADPIGLKKENVSTSYEVALLLKIALENNLIKKALTTKIYSFDSLSGSKKHHSVESTNQFLTHPSLNWWNSQGGKTGYIDESGYCFTGMFKLSNKHEIITVVLDSPQADGRFQDSKSLVSWVSENYKW